MNAAIRSIFLVIAAGAVLLAWLWWLPATPLGRWQRERLHWNYAFQILFFLVPLAVLATRRRRPADYGLVLAEPRRHLNLAVMLVTLLVLVPLLAQFLLGRVALNRTFAAFPLSTIVFHFAFSSFGEELFFRGFLQGELNRAFGRPWRMIGVPFGPGLLVTALVFAAGHALPYRDVQAFFLTGTFALFAGLLRERTGSVIGPAMLHATIDLNWHLLRLDRVLRVAQFTCTGVAFFFILRWIAVEPSDAAEQLHRGDRGKRHEEQPREDQPYADEPVRP